MHKAKPGPPIDEVQSLSSGASLREVERFVDDFTGEAIAMVSRSAVEGKRPKAKAKPRVKIEIRHKGNWRRM